MKAFFNEYNYLLNNIKHCETLYDYLDIKLYEYLDILEYDNPNMFNSIWWDIVSVITLATEELGNDYPIKELYNKKYAIKIKGGKY
jgi:hypothetical protein